MKEQLISFETAKLAKEKGLLPLFDSKTTQLKSLPIYCEYWYNLNGKECFIQYPGDEGHSDYITVNTVNNIFLAPTQSLLQRWLREVHNTEVYVTPWIYKEKNVYDFFINWEGESRAYSTYELALETGLYEALKLINNESKTS
jgi:hypothetical protein